MKYRYQAAAILLLVIIIGTGVAFAQPPQGPGSQDQQGAGPGMQQGPGMSQGAPGMQQGRIKLGSDNAITQGPYVHSITSAVSADGITYATSGTIILQHASVPAAVLAPDGRIFLYYVDASDIMQNKPESTEIAISQDGGITFTPYDLTIEGIPTDKALDPAVVILPDGRYRLYYYASDKEPTGQNDAHEIRSAISEDGITFSDEGVAFLWPGLVDPDVWWNGTAWNMYVYSIAQGQTIIATSDDGVHFTYKEPLDLKNIGTTGPVLLDDGSFRLYAFEQNQEGNIISFRSEDGITWNREPGVRIEKPKSAMISDPSAVHLPDGSWMLFYKLAPQPAMQNQPVSEAKGISQQGPGMQGQNQPGMTGPGGRAP
ncbi:MAG: hypothetical protein JXA44_05060 [Methanospirillaceae archaeon]|nr:hypothetical protein [Methanospirillaceae archaeon]